MELKNKPTLFERLFPGFALKRQRHLHNLSVIKRAYEAGKPSELWKPIAQSQGPNTNTQNASEKMRDQARDLDENHDLAISVLDELVNRIVGSNFNVAPIILQDNGEPATKLNKELTKLWEHFGERPEVTRSMSMGEVFRLACRTWLRDGDALIRFIRGNSIDHPTVIPLSLELIEPDYLPFMKNEEKNGVKIIQGVELDSWGAAVNYHLLTESPYQVYGGAPASYTLNTRAIPANQIVFLKFSRRIAQVRGVTIFHGVIRRFQDIKDYEESERIAARVDAAFTGFIKKDMDSAALDDNATQDRSFEMSPGMIFDNLRPGEDVGTVASNRPSSELLPFRNAMLRAVAGGTSTSFSSIAKTYDGTYSSQRQELVEAQVNYSKFRDYFISQFVKPLWREFLTMAITFSGVVIPPGTDLKTLYDVDIRGVAMPWIDPLKEVNADKISVESGFKSRSQVIRERGGDPEAVNAERAMEKPLITEEPATDTATDTATETATNTGEEDNEQEEVQEDEEQD